MKKLIFPILALIGLTTVAASAQSKRDTTRHRSESMKNENWAEVNSADVPASLQQTLKGSDYEGWTVSKVYRNSENTKYKVELTKDGETKTHFFDQNGNPLHRKKTS